MRGEDRDRERLLRRGSAHTIAGRPHDGPDVEGNVLCLCPNDHVRFEFGSIVVDQELGIVDRTTGRSIGRLRTAPGHLGAHIVSERLMN